MAARTPRPAWRHDVEEIFRSLLRPLGLADNGAEKKRLVRNFRRRVDRRLAGVKPRRVV